MDQLGQGGDGSLVAINRGEMAQCLGLGLGYLCVGGAKLPEGGGRGGGTAFWVGGWRHAISWRGRLGKGVGGWAWGEGVGWFLAGGVD